MTLPILAAPIEVVIFYIKNLVYNINLINFAPETRAESRDRSFFRVKWFIK